jgi:hypothetical protein
MRLSPFEALKEIIICEQGIAIVTLPQQIQVVTVA